jgi:GTP-binding protein
MFVSALTKKRVWHLIDVAKAIQGERDKRISTSELNNELLKILESHPPPAVRGKDLRINFIVQPQATPPVFLCFTNHPDLIPEHYTRYLEHQIRERYGFMGTPLTIVYKQKNRMRREDHSTATL